MTEQPKPRFYVKKSKSRYLCDCNKHEIQYQIITPQGYRLNRCNACLQNLKKTFNNAQFTPIKKWRDIQFLEQTKPKTEPLNMHQQVTCPFCLKTGNLNKFIQYNKKGELAGLAKCPECNNQMRMQTLLADMTVETFARWVYSYCSSGFWNKVPFATFCRRLKEMNISYEFWQEYKRFKGDAENPGETEKEKQQWKDYNAAT